MRRPVSLVYFGAGPGRGLSAEAGQAFAGRTRPLPSADRSRHRAERASNRTGRIEWPSSASSKTIRAAKRVALLRPSVPEPALQALPRSAGVSRTFASMGIHPNVESRVSLP